jgi:integrase
MAVYNQHKPEICESERESICESPKDQTLCESQCESRKVKMSTTKKSKNKHIVKRNGTYYIRKRFNGKIIYRSLSTSDMVIASERAKAILFALEKERFDILDDSKIRKGYSTLGDVFNVYMPAAQLRLKPRTVINNIANMRGIFRHVFPTANPDNLSTTELKPELVSKYFSAAIKTAMVSGVSEERAKRSAFSKLHQARSIFARWTTDAYKDLKLPDLTPFMLAGHLKIEAIKYRLPEQKLIEKTITAGRELKDDDPAKYAVFLLCYDIAMRAGEAISAQWSWIRETDGRFFMDIIRRPGFSPKGKERCVPIGNAVMEHLRALPRSETGYILPGPTKWVRETLVTRDFAGWLRELGWDGVIYPKAAHELRKLMGSRWYTELGAEVAQSWLGHVDISTTCRYYAALTKQPEALEI